MARLLTNPVRCKACLQHKCRWPCTREVAACLGCRPRTACAHRQCGPTAACPRRAQPSDARDAAGCVCPGADLLQTANSQRQGGRGAGLATCVHALASGDCHTEGQRRQGASTASLSTSCKGWAAAGTAEHTPLPHVQVGVAGARGVVGSRAGRAAHPLRPRSLGSYGHGGRLRLRQGLRQHRHRRRGCCLRCGRHVRRGCAAGGLPAQHPHARHVLPGLHHAGVDLHGGRNTREQVVCVWSGGWEWRVCMRVCVWAGRPGEA